MQYMFRNCMLLVLCLALMFGAAYGIGLIQNYFKEERFSAAYGIPALYEDEAYTLKIMLWQGKDAGNPNQIESGISPSGDLWKGNSTAFSYRMLKHGVTVDSVDWTGWNEGRYMYPNYMLPVLQIENKSGGEILTAYSHTGYGNVIYSTDLTRRPVEYENWQQDQWFTFAVGRNYRTTGMFIDGRYDVLTDYSAMAEGVGEMLLTIGVNPFWHQFEEDLRPTRSPRSDGAQYPFAWPVSFQQEYRTAPDCMTNVRRLEAVSYLYVYAMDPNNRDEVITSATVRIVQYSPWFTDPDKLFEGWNQDSLSDVQKKVLREMNVSSHWGCEVTLTEYEEELRIVEQQRK